MYESQLVMLTGELIPYFIEFSNGLSVVDHEGGINSVLLSAVISIRQ